LLAEGVWDEWEDAPLPEWYEQDLEEIVDADPENESNWSEAHEDPWAFLGELASKGTTEWMSDAECAKEENAEYVDLFFSDLREGEVFSGKAAEVALEADQQAQATIICEACPVREMCLRYALENDIAFGAWGGTTQSVRHKFIPVGDAASQNPLASPRSEFPCPNCSSPTRNLITTPQRDVLCRQCGFTWNNSFSAGVVDGYYVRRSVALIDRRKRDEQETAKTRAKKQKQRDDEISKALERRREQLLRYAGEVLGED
jgi:rubrerythrin